MGDHFFLPNPTLVTRGKRSSPPKEACIPVCRAPRPNERTASLPPPPAHSVHPLHVRRTQQRESYRENNTTPHAPLFWAQGLRQRIGVAVATIIFLKTSDGLGVETERGGGEPAMLRRGVAGGSRLSEVGVGAGGAHLPANVGQWGGGVMPPTRGRPSPPRRLRAEQVSVTTTRENTDDIISGPASRGCPTRLSDYIVREGIYFELIS